MKNENSNKYNNDRELEVHRNSWFCVRNRDGYFTLEYDQPQNVVLPVIDDKYILLIKSIRPIINDIPWELPAGGSESNESCAQALQRELAEETGIIISDIDRFIELPPLSEMPGRMPQLLNVYSIELTMKEYDSRGAYDSNEVRGVEIFTFPEIARMIGSNDIYLAPVNAILSRYLLSRFDLF